jgi:hypothetical protein
MRLAETLRAIPAQRGFERKEIHDPRERALKRESTVRAREYDYEHRCAEHEHQHDDEKPGTYDEVST